MSDSLRVIVTGLIGQYPLGGVTWDYLQYVLGLARLGHDVYYLEDTGGWPYNPRRGGRWGYATSDVTIKTTINVIVARICSRVGRWPIDTPGGGSIMYRRAPRGVPRS